VSIHTNYNSPQPTHSSPQQDDNEDAPPPLDDGDIALLKSYGLGPYSSKIKALEAEIKVQSQTVKDLIGIKESDTGLNPPSQWDLVSDKQLLQSEAPLQVARCTKIIEAPAETAADTSDATKYVINIKQIAKFVSGLGDKVAPTDIEEGMRVGVDRNKYSIQIPLPPRIDPTVSLMTVEDKPDVTYDDVGGAKDAMEKLREVLELPLLHPERFVTLGIDPPKGILLYGVSTECETMDNGEYLTHFLFFLFCTASRNGQDSECPCCGQPYRRLFHSCHWFRTRSKIRRRRCPYGP